MRRFLNWCRRSHFKLRNLAAYRMMMKWRPRRQRGAVRTLIACSTAGVATIVMSMPALACSVPFIRTFPGHVVTGTMTVKSGKTCSIPVAWSAGPMLSAKIVQRPTNGLVSIAGSNRIVYRSRPGFSGRDSFTYSRSGTDTRNNANVRTVQIVVTVRP